MVLASALASEVEFLRWLVDLFHLRQIAVSTLYGLATFGVLFVVIYALEWRQGADRSRYASRTFANDVAYALFYRGQVYTVFVLSAALSAIEPHAAFLKLDLLQYLPPIAAYLCWWITFDFFGYWNHRWQHQSRILWAFHSVHHAPETLNFLQSYRLHVVEQLITNLVMYTPALLLGMPPKVLLPVYMAQTFIEALQHTELNWRFGPLYGVFVSPVFHSFHHSAERRHFDRNFGKILSVWDFVFGTAVAGEPRPARFGIEGVQIPESLVQQFVMPFRMLRRRPGAPVSTSASPETVAPTIGMGPSRPARADEALAPSPAFVQSDAPVAGPTP